MFFPGYYLCHLIDHILISLVLYVNFVFKKEIVLSSSHIHDSIGMSIIYLMPYLFTIVELHFRPWQSNFVTKARINDDVVVLLPT